MDVPVLVRRAMLFGLVALAALGLAACWPAAPSTNPTTEAEMRVQNAALTAVSAPTATALPVPTQPITPTVPAVAPPVVPQAIFIDAPPFGTLIGSPVQLAGRTARMPVGGKLGYQVLDAAQQVIGFGDVLVKASAGGGTFDAALNFALPQNGGTVTARLFERAGDGSIVASSGVDLFVQSQVQSVTIDLPPAGTQVGSPMTLNGRVARLPDQGLLSYEVMDSRQQQIGANTFPVFGDPGRPTTYAGSLEFVLPFDGDTITARIYDQSTGSGATVSLYVAPVPQSITIDTPPMGALVGSPMTVTGRTVRFPANGTLNYSVLYNGLLRGSGTFAVGGNDTRGSQFNTQVMFSLPYDGGLIQLTISDPTASPAPAETTITLNVRPQHQGIVIDNPPNGTLVGSPLTITGHTNWFPTNGQLPYRVLDANKTQIGSGIIPVRGASGTSGDFNAQVTFNEPPNGGAIQIELTDPPNSAIASVSLNVMPPPPAQIVIDTPPPNTQVGSPMTITGRTTYLPNGQLSYRVRDAAGTVIGQATMPAAIPSGRQATFVASLSFTEPIAGGNITVEIYGPSPVGGAQISTSIMLYVAPRR
ncbi:MAG: Gmad2 immunoglobulin-like domain-containing protein [Chloroflexota bacterium]|nr:Gmad2 immunoglobulin-like domain-containing protein [Chloroflexota bacterium]